MSSKNIYTRSWAGLDKGVWISMITLMVLSLGLLSYNLSSKTSCRPINFTIKSMDSRGAIYTAGELISFNAGTDNADISWNFGDDSEAAKGGYVTHKFNTAGNYTITAFSKGGCDASHLITIRKPETITNTASQNNTVSGEEIVGPATSTVGLEEVFTCMVNANNYEWSIVNFPKLTRTGMAAKFSFPHAGKFTVQVTLDNDRSKRFTKEVLIEDAEKIKSVASNQKLVPLIPADLAVLPKESKPLPEPVSSPAEINVPPPVNKKLVIADATFLGFLDKVATHEMSLADFDKYLCGAGTTKVVVNGDTKDMKTFSWLVQELGQRKGPKVESASLNRADACVTLILVKFKKKKGFLGL